MLAKLAAALLLSPFFPGMFLSIQYMQVDDAWLLRTVTPHKMWKARLCQKGFPFNTYFRYRLTFWCRQPQQQQVSVPIKKRQRRLRNSRVEAAQTTDGEEEKHFWLAILWQTQAQVLGIHPKSIFHARKTIWTSLTYNNSTPLLLVCHSKDT